MEADKRIADGSLTEAEIVKLGTDLCTALEICEKNHIILGYPALIDWTKTDDELVTALIEVRISPQRGDGFDRIAERIYQYEEVESLYLMSGSYDLAVTITGRSLRAVAEFVHARLAVIDGVTGTATHFILKKYKEKNHLFAKLPEQEERVLFV